MANSTCSITNNLYSTLHLKSGIKLIVLILVLAYGGIVFAQAPVYEFDNPTQEALYYSLVNDLRCLVCQNQNLADSNAELARDLRDKTWEMVVAGASEEQVIDFMTARYGEFVLYRPPFKSSTAVLWIGPFILLAIGIVVIVVLIRRRSTPQQFSKTDRERVRALLDGQDEPL